MAVGPYTQEEAIAVIEGDRKANPKNYPKSDPKAASRRQAEMKKRLAARYK